MSAPRASAPRPRERELNAINPPPPLVSLSRSGARPRAAVWPGSPGPVRMCCDSQIFGVPETGR